MKKIHVIALFAVISLSAACGMEHDASLPGAGQTQSALDSSGVGERSVSVDGIAVTGADLTSSRQSISGCQWSRCFFSCHFNGWNSSACINCYNSYHSYCADLVVSQSLQ